MFMKMKKLLLLLLIPLISLITFTGCKNNELEKVSKNLSTYTMDIVYNEDHTLNVKQTLNYRNSTDTSLNNLKLHLYPNSFREGAKSSVVSTLNYSKCYYNGVSFGNITINKLEVENNEKEIVISGNDEDILDITFDSSIAPNSYTNIYIEYDIKIPNINHRFGYGDDTINLGNFYPIACVYENGEFCIDSYHYNGDPFYSEVANYNVTITTPSQFTLASTGNIISTTNNEDSNTHQIQAITVRDFAFVLSDKFTQVSDNINNTQVNYYYYNDQTPNDSLKAGLDSIKTFNNLFGKYPYQTLNIVQSDFVHGGMEYPNLVLISDMVEKKEDYINVIIHETAHQWWYGIVGNNEFQYGWLDEGLTEYSTLLFYEENPEYNVDTKQLIKNNTNSFATFVEVYKKVFDNVDTSMNRKLNEFNNESEYVYIAYVKGMLIFDSLREVVGKEKFILSLQTYFEDNKFKTTTPNDLINSFEKTTKVDLKNFFDSWINGKVQILAIN